MLEATENISRGRKVILVIVPYEEITVDQVPLEGSEKKIFQSAEIFARYSQTPRTPVYSGVEEQ